MPLVDQKAMERSISSDDGWRRSVFLDVKSRLQSPSAFPCVFSQNAFRKELVLFSFVEDFDADGASKSVEDLTDYVALSKTWDGRVDTAHPLIVAFSQKAAKCETLEEYHAFGWRVLQHWHDVDPSPWPADVATDPHERFWSMCFNGMQLFVNMSVPVHKKRKSRNLGEHLIFVVNPRERFDIVASNTPEGWKVRNNIRRRVNAYDGQPHCPQLGSYKAGEIEWWQYGIIEDNKERLDRCPFRFNGARETDHESDSC